MPVTTIFGVKLNKRMETAKSFQEVLTNHGCKIKTRIGIHAASDGVCSPDGVILLDVIGDDSEVKALEDDIKNLESAEIQKMVFKF